jgi:hypothetical protein
MNATEGMLRDVPSFPFCWIGESAMTGVGRWCASQHADQHSESLHAVSLPSQGVLLLLIVKVNTLKAKQIIHD